MQHIFDGNLKAEELINKISQQIKKDLSLTIIRQGENPAQLRFTNTKKRMAERLGIKCKIFEYDSNCTEDEIKQIIQDKSKNTTGILVQLPLPNGINRQRILNSIPYEKDVEGLSSKRYKELKKKMTQIYSPVAKAIVETCKDATLLLNKDLRSLNVTIVGDGYLIGKPVFYVMKHLGASPILIGKKTEDVENKIFLADILISGIGKPNYITKDMVKQDVIAIDAGFEINKLGKIYGDIHPEVRDKSSFFTPVPGGIGPLTVAYIFDNLLKL